MELCLARPDPDRRRDPAIRIGDHVTCEAADAQFLVSHCALITFPPMSIDLTFLPFPVFSKGLVGLSYAVFAGIDAVRTSFSLMAGFWAGLHPVTRGRVVILAGYVLLLNLPS